MFLDCLIYTTTISTNWNWRETIYFLSMVELYALEENGLTNDEAADAFSAFTTTVLLSGSAHEHKAT